MASTTPGAERVMSENTGKEPAPAGHPRVGPLIRSLRKKRHLTLAQLGDAANLSVGFLSQVERDQASPSLTALNQIAKALGVGIDYFVAAPATQSALTRAGKREAFWVDEDGMVYERLSASFPGSEMTSYIITVPPGFTSEVSRHEGEEIAYQLSGHVHFTLEGRSFVMQPGDSLHFVSTRPHRWANTGSEPARVFWSGTAPIDQREEIEAAGGSIERLPGTSKSEKRP